MAEVVVKISYTVAKKEEVVLTDKEFEAVPNYGMLIAQQAVIALVSVVYTKGSPLCSAERVAEVVAKNYVRQKKGKLVKWEYEVVSG